MTDPAGTGRYRVLVVEGDSREATSLRRTLSDSFHVIVSGTGQEAIDVLKKRSVHVVCACYPVPGMDSVRFLQRALSVPDPPCLLFIASAADLKDKNLDGLSGAIARPFLPEIFVKRVSRLCQVAETRRRVASAQSAIHRHQRDPSETE
jgi:DNA-binding response OmpR family regulator